MRRNKGVLVCIWSPLLHGEGCSTVAAAVGFGLQRLTAGKVIMINRSDHLSYMERFIERDMEVKYTLDSLKVFNESLQVEHIRTYATRINPDLFMIAGSRLDDALTKTGRGFDAVLLDRCLEGFDIVLVDLTSGVKTENKQYLERADQIIAVVTPNAIMLEELFSNIKYQEANRYLLDQNKTTVVLNKLYPDKDWSGQAAGLKRRFSFEHVFGISYDSEVMTACCQDRNFYSYFSGSIACQEYAFASEISEICGFMAKRLKIPEAQAVRYEKRSLFNRFLKKKYSQSEVRI